MRRSSVPAIRIRQCNGRAVRADGAFVLYWMIGFRRLRANFALERAVEWARELRRPLVILEGLRCDYRWAAERHHGFAMEAMAERAAELAAGPAAYYPYVERRLAAGKGLVAALAARAAIVVTDEAPIFFLPRMVAAAAAQVEVAMEAVDSNGLLPVAAARQTFVAAVHFRRFLQRHLADHLAAAPLEEPWRERGLPAAPGLERLVGRETLARWPAATAAELGGSLLAGLPIDHAVGRVAGCVGGERAAAAALAAFIERLGRYAEERNQPDAEATSGLSPYLHWGNLSSHQVLGAVTAAERWSPDRLARTARGGREGWWGMSPGAEAFLDQAVTWREIGFNLAAHLPGYDRYESLPAWALAILERHAADPRPILYDLAALAAGRTHDPLWNAAQTQLRREGRIHNYLRMLWGKKILEWSPTPRQALDALVELNNRYALDGRDPNSYSGIFWTLGRFDRPWPPERPIFGTVRYMTSDAARRKLDLDSYLVRYAAASSDPPRQDQLF